MFTGVPADSASKAEEFVRGELAGGRFGDVRWVAETGSTNNDVMALARDGAPEGAVVVADHQHSGRGRRGRVWVAPAGSSLLLSVLLRPPAPVVGACAMAVGVAMVEAVDQLTGRQVPAGLKWPNDLVVVGTGDAPDRKLAGILAEADWPPGTTESAGWRAPEPHARLVVVVGVGLNVNWPAALPDELAETATALNLEVGHEIDRSELLVAFLRRLDDIYGRMRQEQSSATVVEAWRARSATLGRRVRVDLGNDDVEGTAVDVTEVGHLVVETREGTRRTLAVGDVVHLRPV